MQTTLAQREKMREYFQNNKARYAHYTAEYRDKIRLETIVAYGGHCVGCGNDDEEVLSLDHINDDASVEKEAFGENARGGHKHYGRLKAAGWPKDRFQLLCYNCNAKKEHRRRRAAMLDRWGEKIVESKSNARARDDIRANNNSGIKGVFWNSQKERWQAKVTFNGQGISCGFFTDIRDAARAYAVKARELWGNDANVASEEEIQAAYELQTNGFSTELSIDQLGL